jgi:hypothetical protein
MKEGLKLTHHRIVILPVAIVVLAAFIAAKIAGQTTKTEAARGTHAPIRWQTAGKPMVSNLQMDSLCAKDERILFSCTIKGAGKHPAKIASLCSSRDIDKERGYLQYRFGSPDKVELEFPKDRQGTQQQFRYSHYFRYQIDLTEITFQIDIYEYSVFDTYNGEAKPAVAEQGVNVTTPGKNRDTTFVCRSKAKTDYRTLQDVLPHDQD